MNFINQDDQTTLGIRPEDLRLETTSADEIAFEGTVGMIQMLGDRQIVHLQCADHTLMILADRGHDLNPGIR